MAHILAGCKTTLSQGRYRWRHDKFLKTLADIMEQERWKRLLKSINQLNLFHCRSCTLTCSTTFRCEEDFCDSVRRFLIVALCHQCLTSLWTHQVQ